MITTARLRQIFLLALPIIGGMISQNILNIVDTAMVGHLGPAALAAVGIASFAVFLSHAMVLGVSSGVQAVAARRVGEGRLDEASVPLVSGLLIALVLGGVLTVLLFPAVPYLFPFLNEDPAVIAHGNDYWQIRLLSMIFMGANYAFRGYFNGIASPKYYMWTLILIHILNIVLNYILIFGHLGFDAMGTQGAAWASTIATVVGAFIYFALGTFKLTHLKMFHSLPSKDDLLNVVRLTLPAGVQQVMIALGMTSLFWVVGKIGVAEVAGLNILVNILLLCILPGFGFGMAASTLVGRSLGEGSKPLAKQWAYDVTKVGGALTFLLGGLIAFYAREILGIFTDDTETISAALLPLQLTGMLIFLDVIGVILMNALLGSGDVQVVLKTSLVSQWVVFFPVAFICVSYTDVGLVGIWLLFSFSRVVQGLIYIVYWQRERWGEKQF